jgi:uncharacterized protein YodC (DUF2158 family)
VCQLEGCFSDKYTVAFEKIRPPPTSLGELLGEALRHNPLMRRIAMINEATPRFQVGDVVRLKSGGPAMTVATAEGRADRIRCVWFTEGELPEAGENEFYPVTLVHVPTQGPGDETFYEARDTQTIPVGPESMKKAREYLEKDEVKGFRAALNGRLVMWVARLEGLLGQKASDAIINVIDAMIDDKANEA